MIAIEGLVKRQQTKELQSQFYEFAESCLIDLNREYFKQEGLGKLKADVDYIPGSLRIKPVLVFPTELKADEATITCTLDFNDIVKDCQKKLLDLVWSQATRNLKSLKMKNRKDILTTILSISAKMAGHLKIKLGLS